MDVIELPIGQIIPYARNPRHNEKAIATVAASIKEFGWRQPIVVDEGMVVLAGHTRLAAARQLGLETAPVHVAKGLATDVERPLGTIKPLLMITDPPYGVDYDPGWHNQSGAAKTMVANHSGVHGGSRAARRSRG